MSASGQSVGAASVYLRPSDLNGDGYISTNEVLQTPLEESFFDANGQLDWFAADEQALAAGQTTNAVRKVYYNALLTSAARFGTGTDWNWLGPLNFSGGSVFSIGLLINDEGDVAGTGATQTGNPQLDNNSPTRVFRWSANDGEFTLGAPVVQQLGVFTGGNHAFPLAMNQTGDVVGYSDFPLSPTWTLIQAAFWGSETNEAINLGTLGQIDGNSQAFGINDSRQIVGVSETDIGGSAGVLWQFNHDLNNPNGTGFWEITDLNDQITDNNLDLFTAVGINNAGMILAYGQDAAGTNHAVLITPG